MLSSISMYIDIIAISTAFTGVHLSFYTGSFLPLSALIVTQEKATALKITKVWTLAYIAFGMILGIGLYFIGAHSS